MNKVTSLLVAAAAIVSIVPASAADYKKIDSQEGTVYSAVAYKDGKFFIDGEVNDKDEAAYYLANGKYNAIADVDTGSSITTYGTKYINVEDGDSFLNLETGAVTTDSIKENAEDDTASALRKNVKKDTDGRYTTADAESIKDLAGNELAGNKFGQVWYGVKYAADKATNATATDLNVYTDASGNYIDADYNLGSVKVTTTATGATEKTVTVSNTDDTYDGAGLADSVTASVSNETVIGQDANYIYRTAKVTVKTATGVAVSKIDGLTIATATTAFDTTVAGEVSFNTIQKISKAQASDDVDGAKYAKTVNTYIVSDDAGVAATLLASAKFSIVDGKVIAYTDGASVDAQTIELKSSQGYYYTDVTDADAEDATAVDVDANGNLWRLEGGYVYKFDNNDAWDKIYKVDGAMNKLSVYDQNDMVVWNESDEVYSVISAKATETPVDTTTPPVETKKGWVNTAAGWTFFNAAGTQAKGQWVNDGGVWYMIKADGIMATGWYNDNGTWYFLAGSGAMKTGWVQDGSTWYYLQSSGAMKTGWLNDNGTWYYLNGSGAMLANTSVDGYKLGASGAWVK
jgi:nitrite reductase/ring-hydroxylating ferredoxin subunit